MKIEKMSKKNFFFERINSRPKFKDRPECFLKNALFHKFYFIFNRSKKLSEFYETISFCGEVAVLQKDEIKILFRKAQHKVSLAKEKSLQFRDGRDKG